jgi:hypothetical protein
MIADMFSVLLIAFFGLANAADPSKIMVSKSALRTDAVPINQVTCLTRDNFIYLDQPDDGTVDLVVWYTQSGRTPLKNNIKKELYWPYSFKGGTNVNSLAWDTQLVVDDEYSIHAYSFKEKRNIAVNDANFIVCNNYNFLVSQNWEVYDAQILNDDTVVDDTQPLYLVVSPLDNVVDITVTLDGQPLENNKDSDGNYFFKADVSDYKEWFMGSTEPHALRAEIQLITGNTSIVNYTFPTVVESAAPTAAPTDAPLDTVEPTVPTTTVAPSVPETTTAPSVPVETAVPTEPVV